MDMEMIVEDKTVITESPTGGDSGVCEVDATHELYEGMLFESEEAAKAFYDEYARRIGFSTRIVSSRKSERDGSIISRRLACNKEGFNINRQNSGRVQIRKRESIREGCKAMILVKREKPGRWVVTKFVREHNHSLVISSEKVLPTPIAHGDSTKSNLIQNRGHFQKHVEYDNNVSFGNCKIHSISPFGIFH